MDRNFYFSDKDADWVVALRKESVDRNLSFPLVAGSLITSLSARRAWIEIRAVSTISPRCRSSLSARRAWIEIFLSEYMIPVIVGRSPQGERG